MKAWQRVGICAGFALSLLLLSLMLCQEYSGCFPESDLDNEAVMPVAPRSLLQEPGIPNQGSSSLRVLPPSSAAVVSTLRVPEAAINSLTRGSVSASEARDIYAFLESAGVPSGMTPVRLDAFKNDLMNMLRNLEAPPTDLTQELIRLHANPSQDLLLRVYALQHLATWYDQITGPLLLDERANPRARPPAEVAEVRRVLWDALNERRNGIAGTAILAHYHLAQNHPEFSVGEIGDKALELAGDDTCDAITRMSAMQVCGRMGLEAALSFATRLASDPSSGPLRITAIATLGDLGGEKERVLLVEIANDDNAQLRVACESALKKIGKRASLRGDDA